MDLSSFLITEDVSIFDAASIINNNGKQVAFVCRDGKLVAALSDGDIRRHILRNGDFSVPVSEIANYQPKYLKIGQAANSARYLQNMTLKAVPILNDEGEILSIEFANSTRIKKETRLNIPLVIMAGGKGIRLAPYTSILPKPLMPIGEKTITEHIFDRFKPYGCPAYYMIVNYKKELIKAYFQESCYADMLHFIDETEYLGTGGGLKFLDGIIHTTFFLSNCDILLDIDYENLYKTHKKKNALVTMVCAMKKVSVPYGTVELDEAGNPHTLIEKPTFSMLTNTGVYVIEPEFLEYIPGNTAVGVPEIIQSLIDKGKTVSIYPVSENAWMDMGEMGELRFMATRLESAYE